MFCEAICFILFNFDHIFTSIIQHGYLLRFASGCQEEEMYRNYEATREEKCTETTKRVRKKKCTETTKQLRKKKAVCIIIMHNLNDGESL